MLHATKKTLLLLLLVAFVEDNESCIVVLLGILKQVFILINMDDTTNPSLVS